MRDPDDLLDELDAAADEHDRLEDDDRRICDMWFDLDDDGIDP
jgi:hypothetical protein